MPIGRPPEPVPEAAAGEVLAWLERGRSLRSWCEQDGKPWASTVYDWVHKDREFARRFANAKQLGDEMVEDECFAIADDGRNDWMEIQSKDGDCVGWRVNGEAVARSKLRVWTRLQVLANRNPRRYGRQGDKDPGDDEQRKASRLRSFVDAARSAAEGDPNADLTPPGEAEE